MDAANSIRLLPQSASNFSMPVDLLTLFLLLVSTFFTALIFLLIVYFSLRYRRRRSDDVPAKTPHNPKLEIAWIVVPGLIMAVMFFWGAKLYATMRTPPKEALLIRVVAKQWMWKLEHPDGGREINELHVPVNQPVHLSMQSEDVIHDFYVPDFRMKQDVLPDRTTDQWFIATRPGVFQLFCAEYCGTMHSQMRGRIVVLEPQDYAAWLAGHQPTEPPELAGQRLFQTLGCAQCHGQIAPTLAGVYGHPQRFSDGSTALADENYLRESILNPSAKLVAGFPAVMPTYSGRLTPEQLNALLRYIESLGEVGPTTRPAPLLELNQPPAAHPPPVEPSPNLEK